MARAVADNRVDRSVLNSAQQDDIGNIEVLQAALLELAEANSELEEKVRHLEAGATHISAQECDVDTLVDTVLASARPADLEAATRHLEELSQRGSVRESLHDS